MLFQINMNCVKCGSCADICPVSVIKEFALKYHVGEGCIACGDCFSVCPVNAIEMLNKGENVINR